jgi:hypothetical protein
VWDVYIRAYTSSGPDLETGVMSAFRKMLHPSVRHKKAVFGGVFKVVSYNSVNDLSRYSLAGRTSSSMK